MISLAVTELASQARNAAKRADGSCMNKYQGGLALSAPGPFVRDRKAKVVAW